MDPNAALRMIDEADRVDAETHEVIRGLHQWLSRGGFQPDWENYPTGTRRYRKAYGQRRGGARIARGYATKKSLSHATARAVDNGGIAIGDIVQRSDGIGKNRYVVTDIQSPWIYTRRISGSGAPGIITFPSSHMLRKVD
jgi:hypothetical protein